MDEMYDILIIGAGPAGLTAGLYGSRSNLKTVIIEKGLPGGELLNTEAIEDYTGFEHVTGVELARLMENHARKFGVEIRGGEEVKTVRRVDAGETMHRLFEVTTDEGTYIATTVIVTAGGTPLKLGVTGEEANHLTRFGSKVYVIHRRDAFRAQKILQDQLFQNPKAEVIWDTVVDSIKGDKEVDRITLRSVKSGEVRDLPTQGVFIFIG